MATLKNMWLWKKQKQIKGPSVFRVEHCPLEDNLIQACTVCPSSLTSLLLVNAAATGVEWTHVID